MKKIYVVDVTLKEANNLTFREKLNVCAMLDGLGVNVIELPALLGSEENFVISRTIATSVKNASVAIEVGDDNESVEKAFESISGAKKPILTVALPVSTATMEYGYHLKASTMLEKIKELIVKAKSLCESVRFIAKDAFRAEEGFIEKALHPGKATGDHYHNARKD